MKTSATVKPPLPDYAFSMERGLDPWHRDAAPNEFKDRFPHQGERNGGWFIQDAWGNDIAFVPDGTEFPDNT